MRHRDEDGVHDVELSDTRRRVLAGEIGRLRRRAEHDVAEFGERRRRIVGHGDDVGAIGARDLVDKILSSLSPEDRSLILMVDLEGRSLQEIADTMGWSISKVKMRLFRVRPLLRQMIQRLENEHEQN